MMIPETKLKAGVAVVLAIVILAVFL